jgi:DNA-binding GntR family transcriptional regulator
MARPRDPEAAYQSLARQLREAILRDDYADGRRLPTEAELAAHHRVGRQTVRRAFHDLVAEGLVVRVPGRGTFAAPKERPYLRQVGALDDLMALLPDSNLQLVTPLHRKIDLDAASRLRLHSDVVYLVSYLRLQDATPFCFNTIYLPPEVGRTLEGVHELTYPGTRSSATVVELLHPRLRHPVAEAEQSITAVKATAALAGQLACDVDAALLRIDRLYYSADHEPVELAIGYFVPEHYSYRVRLRRSAP